MRRGSLVGATGGTAACGGVGAVGEDGPTLTEILNTRHPPSTGANSSSKFT